MPDLATHLATAYLAGRFVKLRRLAAVFYLGVLLPDLVSRPIHIVFPSTFWMAQSFHSPVVVFLFCWLISLFFRADQRRPVFLALGAGSLLHFLFDLTQRHLVAGYLWFFPFSLERYSIGWIKPDDYVRWLPLTLLVTVSVFLAGRLMTGKGGLKPGMERRAGGSLPGGRPRSEQV